MKRSIFMAGMLLPVLSYSQNADTAVRSKLVTTAPLLGGINITNMVAPVKAGEITFVIQAPSVDIAIPVYKKFRFKHPTFIRVGMRYQGILLSGEKLIYPNNFHSFTLPVSATYAISRATNISLIGLVSVGSDFKKTIDGNDIMYTAGVRFGFSQNKSFKYGVTLSYTSNYAGSYLLPLPDFDWTINKKLSFTAILPARASLKYKISNTQSIGATIGIIGAMYKLNTGVAQQYLHLHQNTAGLIYDLKVNDRLKLNAIADHTLMQRLETFDVNQKISLNGFGKLSDRKANISYQQNSFILQAGVSYQF